MPHPRRGISVFGTGGAQLGRWSADALLRAVGVQDKFRGNNARTVALLAQLSLIVGVFPPSLPTRFFCRRRYAA
jgi:hypothetical protein